MPQLSIRYSRERPFFGGSCSSCSLQVECDTAQEALGSRGVYGLPGTDQVHELHVALGCPEGRERAIAFGTQDSEDFGVTAGLESVIRLGCNQIGL